MGLYPIPTNAPPMNTDTGQIISLLTGSLDAGPLTLLGAIAAPTTALTAAINTTSGNLNGSYGYVVAFGSGSMAANGTYSLTGWTLAGPVSNTIAPADEQGNLSAIPIGPTGTIVRGLYRNLATGSATTGPFYLVAILPDNTTTTFVDNVADASLGAAAPSANTTGTSLSGVWAGGTVQGSVVNPTSGTVSGNWTMQDIASVFNSTLLNQDYTGANPVERDVQLDANKSGTPSTSPNNQAYYWARLDSATASFGTPKTDLVLFVYDGSVYNGILSFDYTDKLIGIGNGSPAFNLQSGGSFIGQGINIAGSASNSIPSIYFNSISTTFVPSTTVGMGLVDISGFAGIGFFAAGSVGVFSSGATTPGVVLWGSGAVQMASNTPSTSAGALSQESNGLFLGNGSVAQGIPTGGEYEIATMPLPYGTTSTTSTTFVDVGYPVTIQNVAPNAGGTVEFVGSAAAGGQIQLYDLTAGAGDGGVTLAATTGYQLLRVSANFVAGHEYVVQAMTNSTSSDMIVYSARLIAIFAS